MKKVLQGFVPIIIPMSSGGGTMTTKDGIAMLIVMNALLLPGCVKWLLTRKKTPDFMDQEFWVSFSCMGFCILNVGAVAVAAIQFISSHL